MKKIGIVGTGILGEAVGLHLMEVGYDVSAFNRTKEKTKRLEEEGAHIVDSPKQVAENSDLVITIVKDADAVREVIFGDLGIMDGKHDGMCIADMSTVNPNSTKAKWGERWADYKTRLLLLQVLQRALVTKLPAHLSTRAHRC